MNNSQNNQPMQPNCLPNNYPHMVLAMAYVLDQIWSEVYEPELGLARATIFPGLDKPFIGEEMPCK